MLEIFSTIVFIVMLALFYQIGRLIVKSNVKQSIILIEFKMLQNIETIKLKPKYIGKFNVGSVVVSGGIEYSIYQIDVDCGIAEIITTIKCEAIDQTTKKLNGEEDYD